MESVRETLATVTRGEVRRRPLSDCTNSLISDNSSPFSSVSLLKKPRLPLQSYIPLAGDESSAGAARGAQTSAAQTSAAHHNRDRAVKRKCPSAVAMTTPPAIGDSSENLDEVKVCDASRDIFLPDKRKQRLRGRPRKESNQALEDYITQQRKYFAVVDAYELEEEEVAEGEALE